MTDITIFDLLNKLNARDVSYMDNNPEAEKAFVPLLTQRWMTGTNDDAQIYFVNKFVNPYVFTLHKHKRLLWNLMCVANSGTKRKYTWPKQKPQSKNNTILKLVAEFYECSTREAIDYATLLSDNDILEIAETLGKDKEEIAKIKKELK